ncbi:hypothetical protein RFI_35631 [Reticulomyxa filosa]|uniref:Uncharacterized protein n=1 Tax=Reticulomyxa filosa TaxID=46433 RepID=X6LIM9_RETFI|nr:hypothetical protein RFI_35631 [Reticulomyxa filosa]|eukprot:ETO01808.1 hypothetical protein RFI_35631 [Reticulomyxa filosa]
MFTIFFQKTKFNSLLYECDLHKFKMIGDTMYLKVTRNNELQKLLHEVIKNDHLHDLVTLQCTNKKEKHKLDENINNKKSIYFK